ncbi:hypothetical protein H0486_17635 [Lachnospiraceae bacterium MD1]|jgi:leader peptidase (prepilin peptidase)/N-methyltransferase|uniref:Prepilin type IV endopeptidase peptidase domain-containing protein n=1 Tax=Variimorphobacter saccharofermentans TaxID=2755051 RepID=A0A839K7S7_9FIRM|nr:hypothetical protein [Variimorphobacter saccharofermentans]MBB2184691.1 hypothetical protein [Variimorphobacter saccharofermentans]
MAESTMTISMGLLLLFCGIQDTVKKKVYLWIITLGAFIVIACLPFCYSISIADRICGLALGLSVVVLSKATGGKIGMGDGMLLCITGLGLGFWSNLELFAIALILAAIVSIFLLMLRLADRKKSIPFIPFLLIGYVILMLSEYGIGV